MILILTGPVRSGKTTFLKRVVHELKKQQLEIEGFLSEAVLDDQEVIGYDLFDIKKEESIPFIRKVGERGWQRVGSFFFIPQGLARAEEIIIRNKKDGLLFVDEVGPLELAGGGLWPALEKIIFQSSKRSVLVVRANILEEFLPLLGMGDVKVFNIEDKKDFSRLIEEITSISAS
ncbi:MAG: hypothetical protein JSV96_19230 [Candidatus Aminicenantes bacterium]|nr:MAG: hypothetical protein JSV96_19230 [Candidatus Aminicenantes bacterium]